MKKLKPIPKFKSEDQERDFWAEHNVTEYMRVVEVGANLFPNLKLSTETISLRLSKSLLNRIKVEANKKDVPYQSLMKLKLSEAFGTSAHKKA